MLTILKQEVDKAIRTGILVASFITLPILGGTVIGLIHTVIAEPNRIMIFAY